MMIDYLTADEEENYSIAQANEPLRSPNPRVRLPRRDDGVR